MRKKNNRKRVRDDTSNKRRKVEKKKRITKKAKVPRTRNLGTLTESEFFSKIRSALRRSFRFWKPMKKALDSVSRPSQSLNKRLKIEYQCAMCKKWFPRKDVEIDHINPCGSLRSYEDVVPFIERLTQEDPKAYQVLCKIDHKIKTKQDNAKRKE